MDNNFWTIVSALGGWASAIGTFTAAFVALKIANSGRISRLTVKTTIVLQIYPPSYPSLAIIVTNHGPRSAVLTELPTLHYWSIKNFFPKKEWSFYLPPTTVSFPPLSGFISLQDGGQYTYHSEPDKAITQIANTINNWDWRLRLWTLSVHITATNGSYAKAPLPSDIKEKIKAKIKELRSQTKGSK